MKQTVGRREISPLKGILAIIGIILLISLIYVGAWFLWRLTGFQYGNILVWVIGFGVAFFILFRFMRYFEYETDDFSLKIYRAYGKRRRLIREIILRNIRAFGTPEEIASRYKDVSVRKALISSVDIRPMVVVFETEGRLAGLSLQPDDQLSGLIRSELQQKKK